MGRTKEVAGQGRVAILPMGAMEQHGRHLPLNTDNYIVSHLCYELGRRMPDEVVVLPVIPFAFDAHHMHFPGAITIQWNHIIQYLLDVLLQHRPARLHADTGGERTRRQPAVHGRGGE